jgi:hypothetical protein
MRRWEVFAGCFCVEKFKVDTDPYEKGREARRG